MSYDDDNGFEQEHVLESRVSRGLVIVPGFRLNPNYFWAFSAASAWSSLFQFSITGAMGYFRPRSQSAWM